MPSHLSIGAKIFLFLSSFSSIEIVGFYHFSYKYPNIMFSCENNRIYEFLICFYFPETLIYLYFTFKKVKKQSHPAMKNAKFLFNYPKTAQSAWTAPF